jgi:hypothetical protein
MPNCTFYKTAYRFVFDNKTTGVWILTPGFNAKIIYQCLSWPQSIISFYGLKYFTEQRTEPNAGGFCNNKRKYPVPKIIKLRFETSLKSHASHWRPVAISANQILEIWDWFPFSQFNNLGANSVIPLCNHLLLMLRTSLLLAHCLVLCILNIIKFT